MKLLNYSTSRFSLILFLLLSVWAVVFYFEIKDEIYDSLDQSLENQMDLIVERVRQDEQVLKIEGFSEGYSVIQEIPSEQAREFEEVFKDTVVYLAHEQEFEPVRMLQDVFEHKDAYYQVAVSASMVEEDDLVESLLLSLAWLYAGLIISILILNNLLLKKVWNPFYTLLSRLKNFSIEKDEKIEFEPTRIEEFSLLNQRIDQLLQKSVESFKSQKQFIENASHELQTPLAISINKLELLVENNQLDDKQLVVVGSVLNNLERLTRLNKSLLLLSKIENKQFPKKAQVNFNELIKQTIADFEDLAAYRTSEIILTENAIIEYKMNQDLAIILVSNLLKNALIHGPGGKPIAIQIRPELIEVKNAGDGRPLNSETLFSRFKQVGNEGKSTGLGLAISKAIADRFNLRLEYSYNHGHIFRIFF